MQDDEGWITFFPGPFAKVTFGVDHRLVAPVIGEMWFTWHSDEQHFRCTSVCDYNCHTQAGTVYTVQWGCMECAALPVFKLLPHSQCLGCCQYWDCSCLPWLGRLCLIPSKASIPSRRRLLVPTQ